MGSGESKMSVCAPVKAEPAVKHARVSELVDPRSPSTVIDRTPIQVDGPVSKAVVGVKSEALVDPRSPTVGINRTPAREVMRVTVGSLARRLGLLFHNESDSKVVEAPEKLFGDAVVEEEQVLGGGEEELASTEPLLTSQPSLAAHADLLATPVKPLPRDELDFSPFVHLQTPQLYVEIETEGDFSLEEAEEARESPLHKRLSMSLITCRDGVSSSQVFAEVHHDGSASPSVESEPRGDGVDHVYALPSITVEPSGSDDSPAQVQLAAQPEEAEEKPREEQPFTGIRCPTFDPKSPSQVVFKPQWLGKGFSNTGLRARGVHGVSGGKGGSSPLAVRVAVKKVSDENRRPSGKLTQKGTEGRSPLQILKETNSPREQRAQLKVKGSTTDKQRLGQMDRRVLAVSMDKENR